MAMNRVQFQPGLSMAEFLDRYGTEDKCEAALVAAALAARALPARIADRAGTRCSGARGAATGSAAACRHQCSVISGTVFEATKLPLTRWFLAMHLLTQAKNNVSALELKRHLGVCYKTAWLMKHKLMEVMRHAGGRAGSSTAGLRSTTPTSAANARGARADAAPRIRCHLSRRCKPPRKGSPQYACLRQQPFTDEAVAMFAAKSLATVGHVVSDGLWCFRAVTIVGADHEPIVTGSGKASVKLPQFKAVNTLLGNLKTAISGTYHAFDFTKYAHRYLAEFQYRFNRRFNLRSILARLLRAAALTTRRPARVIRLAEECR